MGLTPKDFDIDELKELTVHEFLSKVTRALLYLNGLSGDVGAESLSCIFNILLISIIEGPKEVERVHDLMHEYHDALEARGCRSPRQISEAVREFLEEIE